MPFPLAHPAAILPLKRFCPRFLSFPALVAGSLSPDVGYCFRSLPERFSHRPLTGVFGFCLPVGLFMIFALYLLRWPIVRSLPLAHQSALLPLCERSIGTMRTIVVSLLLGTWMHLFLDSFTQSTGWAVRHSAILHDHGIPIGTQRVPTYQFIYAVITFGGVAWLAFEYLSFLEGSSGFARSFPQRMKWSRSLLLALAILPLAQANHFAPGRIGLIPVALATSVILFVFLKLNIPNPGD